MSVREDPKRKGYYMVDYRYKDFQGKTKKSSKRGFKTKREAKKWEVETLLKESSDLDMTFESFVEIYIEEKAPGIKLNTLLTKKSVIENLILPYFKDRKISEITPRDVLRWQNTIRSKTTPQGKPYADDTLENIHSQLSAIFNHAVNYYGLKENPAAKAGGMGRENPRERECWTLEEYKKFSRVMMDEPKFFYAFEMLFWCGLRIGELLALTPNDFDFKARILRVNKSYQRLQKQDIITTPKTPGSVREIILPEFLCEEMQEYLNLFYSMDQNFRIFSKVNKSSLGRQIERGSRIAGIKRIQVHGLRHSHVTLLAQTGVPDYEIGKRVGHKNIHITRVYKHSYDSQQEAIAQNLNNMGGNQNV